MFTRARPVDVVGDFVGEGACLCAWVCLAGWLAGWLVPKAIIPNKGDLGVGELGGQAGIARFR